MTSQDPVSLRLSLDLAGSAGWRDLPSIPIWHIPSTSSIGLSESEAAHGATLSIQSWAIEEIIETVLFLTLPSGK